MLSKTSIVILGLLCKGEKNAYDMLKMIDSMNMKYWLPIGATTLYETCIRLQKKGLIEDSGESQAKAIYRITDKGKQELKKTILALFGQVDYDTVWCCLAVMYSDILSKEELESAKQKRAVLLDEYEKGTKLNRDILLQNKVPYTGICAIERMIHIVEMEKETLSRL